MEYRRLAGTMAVALATTLASVSLTASVSFADAEPLVPAAPVAEAFTLPELIGPYLSDVPARGTYIGVLDGFTEISAVCTHPDARGRGLAAALTRTVALAVLERGETPFLHVAAGNDGARRVYERLGFRVRRDVDFAWVESPPA